MSWPSMCGMEEPENQPAAGHYAESREQPAFGTVNTYTLLENNVQLTESLRKADCPGAGRIHTAFQ